MPLPYLNSNLNVDFPFAENMPRLSNETVTIPINFLCDAVVRAPSSVEEVYVKSITAIAGGDPALDFLIADISGSALVTIRIYSSVYANRKVVSQYDSTTQTLVRLICGNASFSDFFALISGSLTFPNTATRLSEHAFDSWAKKIQKFRVSTDAGATYGAWRQNTLLKLKAGYNIQLTKLAQPAANGATQIQIAAIAGAGAGVESGSSGGIPAVGYLAKLGDAIPDTLGNVRIEGDDCYRVELYPSGLSHSIRLWNDCDSCCTCSDYTSAAGGLIYMRMLIEASCESCNRIVAYANNLINTYNSDLPAKRKKVYAWATAGPLGSDDSQFAIYITLLNNKGATVTPSMTITLPTYWTVVAESRCILTRSLSTGQDTSTENTFMPGVPAGGTFVLAGPQITDRKYGYVAFIITRDPLAPPVGSTHSSDVTIADVSAGIVAKASFVEHQFIYLSSVSLAATTAVHSTPTSFTITVSPGAGLFPPVWTYSISCGDLGTVTGSASGASAAASHTYALAGTYTAIVVVNNGGAPVSSTPITVTVT